MNNLKMTGGGRASLIDDRKRTRKRRVIATVVILVALVVLIWLSIDYLNKSKSSKKEEPVAEGKGVTDVMAPPTPLPTNPTNPVNPPIPLPTNPVVMSTLRIRLVNEVGDDARSQSVAERLRQIGYDQITQENPWYPRKNSRSVVLYHPGAEGVAEAATSITERFKLDKPVPIAASLVLGLDFPKHKDLPIKHKNVKSEKNAYIEILNGTDQPYVSKTNLVEFLRNRKLIVAGSARNYTTDKLQGTFILTGSGGSRAAQVLKEIYELGDAAVKEDNADIIIIVGEGL
jgi:hypothetical protein